MSTHKIYGVRQSEQDSTETGNNTTKRDTITIKAFVSLIFFISCFTLNIVELVRCQLTIIYYWFTHTHTYISTHPHRYFQNHKRSRMALSFSLEWEKVRAHRYGILITKIVAILSILSFYYIKSINI